MEKAHILIVEDDADIREGIHILLANENYEVFEASSGEKGLELFDKQPNIDLVILDIMMPGMSGIEVCRELRRRSTLPILFLSAKTQDADKALGLVSGGDDYLAKPFSSVELLARVNALLRRYHVYQNQGEQDGSHDNATIIRDNVELDLRGKKVLRDGKPVVLTDTEYGILSFLANGRGTVFSAQEIYENVWGKAYDRSVNATLMVHISRLRNKLETDPKDPRLVRTVWGKGYRFE